MSENWWALIDCNNFFVSCERVFRPDLAGAPVVVLSSNDGCAVSRSQEAKALGVKMGQPKFELQALVRQHGLVCFSSNFKLYADLSERLMTVIGSIAGADKQEIYSIDECFVRLSCPSPERREQFFTTWGRELKRQLQQGVGIPVTVGIAPTKTLAKLAANWAKHDPLSSGVQLLTPATFELVATWSVAEVWGIGQRLARRLFAQDITTIGQFLAQPRAWVKQEFGVSGERIWCELRGEGCLSDSETLVGHRQILRSRSFGSGVTQRQELERAVAEYLTVASESLRRHHARAGCVSVFIRTSRFASLPERLREQASVGLPESTSYLPSLMTAAQQALAKIYRPGYVYKRAGVILSALEYESAWQPTLLPSKSAPKVSLLQQQKVMAALEIINRRYGQRKLTVATAAPPVPPARALWGQARLSPEAWRPKASARSGEYTTSWKDLRLVI